MVALRVEKEKLIPSFQGFLWMRVADAGYEEDEQLRGGKPLNWSSLRILVEEDVERVRVLRFITSTSEWGQEESGEEHWL